MFETINHIFFKEVEEEFSLNVWRWKTNQGNLNEFIIDRLHMTWMKFIFKLILTEYEVKHDSYKIMNAREVACSFSS